MPDLLLLQLSLQGFCLIRETVARLASGSSLAERGMLYTKPEVVDFILDLVGHTVDQPLADFRLLELAFGSGDFILRAVVRLLSAGQRQGNDIRVARLSAAIRG